MGKDPRSCMTTNTGRYCGSKVVACFFWFVATAPTNRYACDLVHFASWNKSRVHEFKCTFLCVTGCASSSPCSIMGANKHTDSVSQTANKKSMHQKQNLGGIFVFFARGVLVEAMGQRVFSLRIGLSGLPICTKCHERVATDQ